jgi:ketosteroid isomerase-like protein
MSTTLTPADRLDIQDLFARYAWALDTGDADAFVDCFTADGVLHWDSFEPPIICRGTAGLRRFVDHLAALPDSAGRQHHVSNVRISGAGDAAQAQAFALVTLRAADGQVQARVAGYYEDELRREAGGWRIHRRVIRDWAGPVLGRFAGQTGERASRPRPAVLDGLSGSGVERPALRSRGPTVGDLLDHRDDLYDFVNRAILTLSALKAVVDADLCAHLGEEPVSVEALAERCGVPLDRMRRLVAYLLAEGVVEQGKGGVLATARSRRLLELAPVVLVQSKSAEVGPFLHEGGLRGISAYEARFGKPVFAHLAEQPNLAESFARMMDYLTRRVERFVFTRHVFRPFRVAVDVGGSHGRLLLELLARHPESRGIVFDLPDTAARVAAGVRASPVGDRAEVVGGDFFVSVPAADLYLLKMILHDWDDQESIVILRRIREAIAPDGRIAVIDHLLPEVPAPDRGYLMDIAMMVWASGRERRLSEFEQLFAAAGFRLDRVTTNTAGPSVIEAVPVPPG